MKVILLGAGYATRLYPLTKNNAKSLLEVADKIITDHILEKKVKVPKIDEIIIVTNDKFAHQFEDWIEEANYEVKLTGVNDSTSTNETRLGALGNFIPYLLLHNEVKAFVFEGKRYDIGAVDSYNKFLATNKMEDYYV